MNEPAEVDLEDALRSAEGDAKGTPLHDGQVRHAAEITSRTLGCFELVGVAAVVGLAWAIGGWLMLAARSAPPAERDTFLASGLVFAAVGLVFLAYAWWRRRRGLGVFGSGSV